MTEKFDELKKMVEDTGIKVGATSDECVLYKTTHKNCGGCKYELGCCKYVTLVHIEISSILYQHKDFNDFMVTAKKVGELITRVIEAKTSDEVSTII